MSNEIKDSELKNVTGGDKYTYNGKEYDFCLTVPGTVHCPNCNKGWGYLTYCPIRYNDLDTNILHCDNCNHIWTQRCF